MGMGRKPKPIRVCGNTFDHVKGLPAKRYEGDCAIVAASLATRLPYSLAAEALIAEGVYYPEKGGGSPQGLVRWLQREFWRGSRVRWQYEGISLKQYLTQRPDWTGVLCHTGEEEGDAWHAVAIQGGLVYNNVVRDPRNVQVAVSLARPW